jgi:hypothetical protein
VGGWRGGDAVRNWVLGEIGGEYPYERIRPTAFMQRQGNRKIIAKAVECPPNQRGKGSDCIFWLFAVHLLFALAVKRRRPSKCGEA